MKLESNAQLILFVESEPANVILRRFRTGYVRPFGLLRQNRCLTGVSIAN